MSSLKHTQTAKPVVLCFSGHDPSGGAGIQADIEAIAAHGAHAVSLITALTRQDSAHVYAFEAVDAAKLQAQAETLLNDIPVAAIKIGMCASVAVVQAIHHIIAQHPDIPLILDPVLASDGGDDLSDANLVTAINSLLLPYCQLITPNIPEALKLTHESADNLELAAQKLLSAGSKQVLITGTHSASADITHQLYQPGKTTVAFHNKRLAGHYHGSGCTLASSIAALIAQGKSTHVAIQQALDYTFSSLQHSHCPGKGQRFPDRFYPRSRQP
ncbi:MAG: hydroxymethylpyrimidine/phosphomethylpyrimidine kinase [Gammaproteobacteria bacterium]|nr:hydroxymethylpyrimidine/phosphomethylpyrimidine kinase [Gammaproteobacteria bacterium]